MEDNKKVAQIIDKIKSELKGLTFDEAHEILREVRSQIQKTSLVA